MFTGKARLFTKPVFYVGGGEVMFLMTASELRGLGMTVETEPVSTSGQPDIVHFFGSHGCEFGAMARSLKNGYHIPYVISTVLFSTPRSVKEAVYVRAAEFLTRNRLSRLIPGQGFRNLPEFLSGASMLLPNTRQEADLLRRIFPLIPESKITVIPNGVEERFVSGDAGRFRDHFHIDGDFILNVARLEPRKNQLLLIRAANSLNLPLVLIGKDSVYPEYASQCRAEAGPNVRFIEEFKHEDPLLEGAYAACRVFALPSIHETPGIAALEAALAGARIVITSRGGAQEYFGEFARYVDWNSVADLKDKLSAAWNGDLDVDAQRQHILQYSWQRVAKLTSQVYERVLTGGNSLTEIATSALVGSGVKGAW